mmetsp:Transcript_60285/g.130904  ORF Transcript_60285/g.130904 Transcript_60285/m.130904 type:complete len:94 (+) Transcript_60285:313-594(+)
MLEPCKCSDFADQTVEASKYNAKVLSPQPHLLHAILSTIESVYDTIDGAESAPPSVADLDEILQKSSWKSEGQETQHSAGLGNGRLPNHRKRI